MGLGLALLAAPRRGGAHCDTLGGPVVRDATAALSAGDVTPILKWIRAEDEREVRDVSYRALAVRAQGDAARALADRLLFETVVRLHRAGEGASFTGLKPAGELEPGVAEADKAIEDASSDALLAGLSAEIEHGVRQRLDRVIEAERHAADSVVQGRAFVAAYVDFVHYVEGREAALAHPEHASGEPHGGKAH
jgi:hypothetical protein